MPSKMDNSRIRSQQKKQKLKKGRQDPPSEPESEEEEIWESDSESDSTYIPPPKKSNRRKNRVIEESEEEESEDYDEDDSGDEDIDPREFRKLLNEMFPSKYMNKKVKEDKKSYKKASKKKPVKKSRKVVEESEESEDIEESEEDEDEDDEGDEDLEDDVADEEGGKFSLVFTYGGGNPTDEQDEAAIEDDADEELDSDDEQQFMKEKYEKIQIPTPSPDSGSDDKPESKRSKSKNKVSSSKSKGKSKEDDLEEAKDVESEYTELLELKKHLSEKLKQKPKSKILIHAIEECRQSIKKLVQKTRLNNARKYHKMINSEQEQTSEIDYFKKKLSNKEQLRVMKELKEINEHIRVDKPYRLMLLDSNIPPKYKATVMQKVNMLKMMEPGDSEYHKIKYWVDAFMRVPFSIYKNLSVRMDDGMDKCTEFMERSKTILDECVYGLEDAKMQIMQMVGQWISNPSAMGTAIAIKGPMGTGKTTLVKEGISKILGREFAFIALGGTGDASFLEGHSYTYEGSTWGKIAQILMDSKCMNPVIYFDELDKVSETAKGEEITGILTHLTDTTQNNQFHDKYFSEVDFDLSKCLFIFSYNDESKVNPILKDRMYRIETKGYDAKEKVIIARNYLLPKIREQVNFTEEEVIIPDETIQYIVGNKALTNEEAGVRNLKRCLEIVYTKINLYRLMKPGSKLFGKEMELEVQFPFTVTKEAVDAFIKNEEKQNQSLLSMYV
jgi:ATP-dependent Lon protease